MQTTLARLTDSWLSAINRSDLFGDVFLDLKKASDLVDHRILLSKLSVYLNSSNSLPFFFSYLKNRVQRVFIHGSYSSEGTVKYVVPQGSVLGPASILMIYFCIYHQILQNVICSRMTTLHTTGKSVVQIQKTLQLCLDRISVWCNVIIFVCGIVVFICVCSIARTGC